MKSSRSQFLGGSIRKGQKSSLVIFWTRKTPRGLFLLRYYGVFNLSQTEGNVCYHIIFLKGKNDIQAAACPANAVAHSSLFNCSHSNTPPLPKLSHSQ